MELRTEVSPVDGVIHSDNIALLLACKTASTYQQLQNAEPLFFPGGDSYTLLIDSPRFSRTTIVYNQTQGRLLIVINGVDQNWSQIPAVIESWVSAGDANETFNVYAEAAAQILSELPNRSDLWDTITIIGHSFGGAVAHWLGRALSQSVVATVGNVWVYTYGAPKTDTFNFGYPRDPVSYRRVTYETDPVPALPPGPTDMGSVWMLCGVPTARSWERWRHYWQAYKLYADGSMNVAQLDSPIPDPGLIFTLFSWATGLSAFGNPGHSLDAYRARFSLTPVTSRQSSLPTTSRDTTQPARLTAVQIAVTRDTAVAITATTVAASPEAAAMGVMTGIPRVPGQRFYGGRVNGQPYVFYNGQPILPTRTLRVRRAVVRRLNATLPF